MSSSDLWVFPRHDGRFMAPDPRSARSPLGASRSKKSAALWKVGQTRLGRTLVWRAAHGDESAAWQTARSHLALTPDQEGDFAILGERGPQQRLILVASHSPWIAKVPVGDESALINRQEFENYSAVRTRTGGSATWLPDSKVLTDGSLLVERLEGSHPRWDDAPTIAWVLEEFRWARGGAAIAHGDLTPWNIILVGGSPRVIDWELAALDLDIRAEFNAMDYILRGAVVARDDPKVVARVMQRHGLDGSIRAAYLDYRKRLRNAAHDSLASRVDGLLASL